MTYPIEDIDAARESEWKMQQAKQRKKQLEKPEKKIEVRPDWSPAEQNIASFLAANGDFNDKIHFVPDDEPYLINLLEEVTVKAEDDE